MVSLVVDIQFFSVPVSFVVVVVVIVYLFIFFVKLRTGFGYDSQS